MYKPKDLIDYRIGCWFVDAAREALRSNNPHKMRDVLERHYKRLRSGPGRVLQGSSASFTDLDSCPDQQVYAVLAKEVQATEKAIEDFRESHFSQFSPDSPPDIAAAAVAIAIFDEKRNGSISQLEEILEIASHMLVTGDKGKRRQFIHAYGAEVVTTVEAYAVQKAAELQPTLFDANQ